MPQENQLSVHNRMDATLEPRTVGAIKGRFFVPSYQRGYRWGRGEVERLLDDIKASGDEPYYLQPLVVKPMEDGRWELVDGQQRLTTLYLIWRHIHQEFLRGQEVNYSLEYETRSGSWEYLQNPTLERREENIDFWHISEAHTCIRDWFEAKSDPMQAGINIRTRLAEKVHVLWYEAPETVDSTTLFTRLNVGRIPLTDAELVKALLLTRSMEADGTSRASEVAAQWDSFERDLRAEEVWAFVSGKADRDPTHISLLLDSLAGGPMGRERPLFHTFETLRARIDEGPQEFWNEVVRRHSLVIGWFEDRDLYHKVGFLISSGHTFQQVIELAEGRTRRDFGDLLNREIIKRLALTRDELRDLSYKDKGTGLALFLMNVETVRKVEDSWQRYSFRAHASGSWTLEHIHAQSSEGLSTVEQWTEWLQLHRKALTTLPTEDEDRRDELIDQIDKALPEITRNQFLNLQADVVELFTAGDADGEMHSIANLALLGSGDNSALNNSVFEVKRQRVLERDRAGSYIPTCTRRVFLKYYTQVNGLQLHFWGPDDRSAYMAEMQAMLGPYLSEERE